jgi:DnaA-homolog protein
MSTRETARQRAAAARGAQLALRFPPSSRATFDSFEAGANVELISRLRALDQGNTAFCGYYLFGTPGIGRSHLLQAACQRHGSGAGAIYLPLANVDLRPGLLEGLDSRRLVALDDIECWLGNADAEMALLGLYQELVSAGGRLLISAGQPAAALRFHFADLASRLRALPAYQVQPLDDAGKARILVRLAARRGLELSVAVLDFWLARSARDLPSLLDEFDRLDTAALAGQRRITVPLVKEVLDL